MSYDAFKNFAKGTVSTGYDNAATSIALTAGHGARFPAAPFNATWWNSTDYPDPADDPNVEIVRVTGVSTDTLTITRAQESTTASAKNTAGKTYKLVAGFTRSTLAALIADQVDTVIRDKLAGLTGSNRLDATAIKNLPDGSFATETTDELKVNEQMILSKQGTAPSTPPAGYTALYIKSDGKLYAKDDSGNETLVQGATAADPLLSFGTAISADITLSSTAWGKTFIVTATTADLTITLPAISGHTGEAINFIIDASSTKLVILDGNGSETLNGSTIRVLCPGESARIVATTSEWTKLGGRTIAVSMSAALTSDQTISSGTTTVPNFTAEVDALGMWDSTNKRFRIPRAGTYTITLAANFTTIGTTTPQIDLTAFFDTIAGTAIVVTRGTRMPAANTANAIGSKRVALGKDNYVIMGVSQWTGSSKTLNGTALMTYFQITEVPSW